VCGIVGIVGPQEDGWIDAMNGMIVHRGPDDFGEFRDREASVSMAMRRLAIVDIAGGHQPMLTPDGRFAIVFNGEIFNAPELRMELLKGGAQLRSDHSDTEVLLHLYARDGQACLDRLNGMFAFVVYDRLKRNLFCARDRFGIKPFYFTETPGRFAFASELKSLVTLPYLNRELHRQGAFDFMSLMYVCGTDTILKNIKRLGPGRYLTYDLATHAVEVTRWWCPVFPTISGRSARDWREEIRVKIGEAVRRWTLADVPIGCSLSGGLDSSAIVGILSQMGKRVRTYSLGFEAAGEAQWNELPAARQVARMWGTEHRELVLNPDLLLDELPQMVWQLDEPYGGGLPSWTVFKFMQEDVKVGLTGTGGDELFGNYAKWRKLEGGWLRRRYMKEVSPTRFRREFFERHYYFTDADKRAIFETGGVPYAETDEMLYQLFRETAPAGIRNAVAYVDLQTQLPEEFLMMTDRFSMAHSVEARTPFLDHELAATVFSIPAGMRTGWPDPKRMLRDAIGDLLPPEHLHRPKSGFVLPLRDWLRGNLRATVENLLAPNRLKAQGILRPEFFERYVRPHLDGRADYTAKVWAAFMFQLWHLIFIEQKATHRPAFDVRAIAG